METKEIIQKVNIVKGAEKLFFKFGIRNVSMDEIAGELGMSKKTLYKYFHDKDEIVHSLMIQKIEEDKCMFTKTYKESSNVVEEVFGIMRNMRDILTSINPVIFYELQKYYPNTWKVFLDFKHGFILEQLERSILKGQLQGLVRNDIDIKIVSKMRLENIDMGFSQSVFPPDKFNMLEVQLAMTEHFLYGICTLKGHKLINKFKNINEE